MGFCQSFNLTWILAMVQLWHLACPCLSLRNRVRGAEIVYNSIRTSCLARTRRRVWDSEQIHGVLKHRCLTNPVAIIAKSPDHPGTRN